MNWQELCEHVGLSVYEAKIYLSLIKTGPLKASKLSIVTGIPRAKVYATLKKLIDMGLVIESPEKPKRFVPTPPTKAFQRYLSEYERKARSLFLIVSSLDRIFDETGKKEVPQGGMMWVFRGKKMIFEKIEEMLAGAREIVEIKTSERGSILLYKRFNRLLDRLSERSVDVHFITRFGDSNKYVLEQLRHLIKITDANIFLPLIFVNVDKKHFLMATMEPDSGYFGFETETAIFSDNQILAKIVQALLHLETKSAPWQERARRLI